MNYKLPHINLLLKRLVLALLIFTLCRILFFAFNFSLFSTQPALSILLAFAGGIRFDLSALIYCFSPVIVMHLLPFDFRNKRPYQITLQLLFMICTFVVLILNLSDTGYFTFSGKRSGMELIRMQSTERVPLTTYLEGYWHLVIILVLILVLAWLLYPSKRDAGKQKTQDFSKITESGISLLLILIFFVTARGSFGLKPLNTLDAARISGPDLMPLTLNTPFQMLMTLEQKGVEIKNYMSEEEAERLFTGNRRSGHHPRNREGKNMVLIILESVGREYVGYYNNGEGYTPFIDSLMHHSTVYTHAYANGKRSIEGIPAIIASMPSWMPADYINSFYQTNKLHSTGYHLAKNGYDVSFYHGGKNGTMSFDRFVAGTGAGNYFGLNEYPDRERDFDGSWGIYDEPYLQYFARQLSAKPQPFYSTVFTLSSHHPYQIPAQYKTKFKGGPLPIHATVQYTDYALSRFFETARQLPWYKNTVFIITADHSSENTKPYYQTSHGKYLIPLFVFDPAQPEHIPIENQTVDHLHIMPMILDQLLPEQSPYFSMAGKFPVQYDGGIYQLVANPYLLRFDGEKTTAFYQIDHDSLLRRNLMDKPEEKKKIAEYEHYLKAFIQQYNTALSRNKTN